MTIERDRGISSIINDPRADPLMPPPFRKAGASSKRSLFLDNSSRILLKNVYDKRGSTKSMLNKGRPSFGLKGEHLESEKEKDQQSKYNIVKARHMGSYRSMSLANDPSILKIGMNSGSPSRAHLQKSPSIISEIQNEGDNTINSLNYISVKLPEMHKGKSRANNA